MTQSPTLQTATEVSKRFKVSIKTVRNWTSARRIPSLKLNGAVRYSEDEIMTWLAENAR